jgi:four helix bundle protein
MSFIFEKLEVYQKAVECAERIATLSKGMAGQGYYHLLDQLRRASLSISLNIAEGNGRWHTKDTKNFFWIARGSVFEMRSAGGTLPKTAVDATGDLRRLQSKPGGVFEMLTALVKGSDRRDQQKSRRRNEIRKWITATRKWKLEQ